MKSILMLAAAALIFAGVPSRAFAVERGCAYRLSGLQDAEIAVAAAIRNNDKQALEAAKIQLQRARDKAFEEHCIGQEQQPQYQEPGYRYEGNRYDGNRFGDRDGDDRSVERLRQRIDYLERTGEARGLTRDEFRELQALRRRLH